MNRSLFIPSVPTLSAESRQIPSGNEATSAVNILDAIEHRRSVRKYKEEPVPSALVMRLLHAAILAPSACNQQPWAFAVIRGRNRLEHYSKRVRAYLSSAISQNLALHQHFNALDDVADDVFHRAGTLVVIFAKPALYDPLIACCFAAQNLMLAAHGFGLGSCPIGFAQPWLNQPEIKTELGMPLKYTAAMPIVVGWPAITPIAPPRSEPEFVWQEEIARSKPVSAI